MVMESSSIVQRLEILYDNIGVIEYKRIGQERDITSAKEAKLENARLAKILELEIERLAREDAEKKERDKNEAERKLNLARERSKQESKRREYQLHQIDQPQEKLSFFGWIRKHFGNYSLNEKLDGVEPAIHLTGTNISHLLNTESCEEHTIEEPYYLKNNLDDFLESSSESEETLQDIKYEKEEAEEEKQRKENIIQMERFAKIMQNSELIEDPMTYFAAAIGHELNSDGTNNMFFDSEEFQQ